MGRRWRWRDGGTEFHVCHSAKARPLCAQAAQLWTVDTDPTHAHEPCQSKTVRPLALFFSLHLINTFPAMGVSMGTAVMAGLLNVIWTRATRVSASIPPLLKCHWARHWLPAPGMLISNWPSSPTSPSGGKPAKTEFLLHTRSIIQ